MIGVVDNEPSLGYVGLDDGATQCRASWLRFHGCMV